ncbi:MAG: hypothetical protein ACJ71D_06495 [Nitrososphaera sp.]
MIEEAMIERQIASGNKKNDEVTFVSGIAGTLAANQKFEESVNAEKWWKKTYSEWLQKGIKVTMIYSHPSTIFDKSQPPFIQYRQAITSAHQIVCNLIAIICLIVNSGEYTDFRFIYLFKLHTTLSRFIIILSYL